tara:strand:- start:141 stop:1172 length:1032 start_codon:yes stop_codon:yes gene_type:complete
MSEAQTNPEKEVTKPQLNMFDVMFGSEETTNPEQAVEKPKSEVKTEAELVSKLQEETEEVEEEAVEEENVLESAEETELEEEVEVEEEVVETETPSTYTIKVDGEEQEVTLDELRNGYQRQADYTRKSQSLAEQRKAYESNLEAVQKERNQYDQALQVLAQNQYAELKEFENIDWKTLKQDDPVEYMEKRVNYQDAKEKIGQVQAEQQRVRQQTQTEMQQIVEERIKKESELLVQKLPEYADPSSGLKEDLRQYTLGLGFSEDDVNGITDHRVVLVLHKAMLQDKGSKASVKKTKTVPKVVKSGTPATKAQKSKRAKQTKRERLAKTGHHRDAANVFLDLLES